MRIKNITNSASAKSVDTFAFQFACNVAAENEVYDLAYNRPVDFVQRLGDELYPH